MAIISKRTGNVNMGAFLSSGQIADLLDRIGAEKVRWSASGESVGFCCPIHGERRPSCGISVPLQAFNCFSCGEKGSLAYFLYRSLPGEFPSVRRASDFLRARYGASGMGARRGGAGRVRRCGDFGDAEPPPRETKPLRTLAPFRSGKETYRYFFDRGFTFETMERFMIGYDSVHETVTIPVFWEDGALAGVVGRRAYPRGGGGRYMVYGFRRGALLYPLDKADLSGGMAILVEGHFDAIRMHELGYANALALQSSALTEPQAEWLLRNAGSVLLMLDNDDAGRAAAKKITGRLKRGLDVLATDCPPHGKDPCDWSADEIAAMVAGRRPHWRRSAARIRGSF